MIEINALKIYIVLRINEFGRKVFFFLLILHITIFKTMELYGTFRINKRINNIESVQNKICNLLFR